MPSDIVPCIEAISGEVTHAAAAAERELVLAWIDERGSRRRIDRGLGQLKVRDLESALGHETVRLCLLTGIQIMIRHFTSFKEYRH